MSAVEAPKVLLVQPNVVLGSWRGVLLEDFRRPVTVAEVRTKYGEQLRFMRGAGKCLVFSVVRPDAVGVIQPETRKVIDELSPSVDPYTEGAALVLLARGFAATVVRTVVAGMMLVRRSSYPARVYDSVDAGASWLAQYKPEKRAVRFEAQELARAYELLAARG